MRDIKKQFYILTEAKPSSGIWLRMSITYYLKPDVSASLFVRHPKDDMTIKIVGQAPPYGYK
jgi:hypothetical protein